MFRGLPTGSVRGPGPGWGLPGVVCDFGFGPAAGVPQPADIGPGVVGVRVAEQVPRDVALPLQSTGEGTLKRT